MIDTFTGWIKSFPTWTEKAEEVVKKKNKKTSSMKSFWDLVCPGHYKMTMEHHLLLSSPKRSLKPWALFITSIVPGDLTPLQYSCLENPMDGGAWWAAVHGVAKSRTQLKRLSSSSSNNWRKPCSWAFQTEGTASCFMHLEQHCPVELSGIMEVSCICTIWYHSHQSPVAVQHLKCSL